MKVLCPQCERLGELERFRLEGTTLVVSCLKCGAEHRVEAENAQVAVQSSPSPVPSPRPSSPPPAPRSLSLASAPHASNVVMLRTSGNDAVERAARAAKGDPFEVPAELCPKCIAPRPAGAASCPQCGLAFAQFSPSTVAPSEWLAESWRVLLLTWGEDAKHDELRVEALQREELVSLGRLYRLRLAAMPEDPFAQRGREEVLKMVTAPVSHRAPRKEEAETSKVKLVLAVLLLIGALIVAGLMMNRVLTGLP